MCISWGHAAPPLDEVPRYKPEGRGCDYSPLRASYTGKLRGVNSLRVESERHHWTHCEPLKCTRPPNRDILYTTLCHGHGMRLPAGPTRNNAKFKYRLYGVLLTMVNTGNGTSELQIGRQYPGLSWPRVWTNAHATGLSDSIKSTWYAAIHDIIPTNERLATIHLTTTTSCARCGATDALLDRLIECDEGPVVWTWTRARIVAVLRLHPKHIPEGWTLRPNFHQWPPQKQAAIVWIVAHLVTYRHQTQRRLSLADYMDFLKRAR